MTTNQTIDGVPRELLELLMRDLSGGGDQLTGTEHMRAYRELRALLDAPAKPVEPVAYPTLSALLADLPEGYNKDDVAFGWNECVDNHRCPAAQPQGEPVAYRFKEGRASWENEKPWEPTTLAHGAVLLERKALAENGTFKGDERDHYLALTVEPLYAEQPAPVAVVMSFDFEHPFNKEKRTVALSKQDVFNGMEDYFYDKLGEQICHCESVGETNVVDCSCDEYVHDFEIVKTSLTS